MTYEEFLKNVKVVDIDTGHDSLSVIGEIPDDDSYYGNEKDLDIYLYNEIATGGVSGGSCWEDSCPQSYHTGASLGRFKALRRVVQFLHPKYLSWHMVQ